MKSIMKTKTLLAALLLSLSMIAGVLAQIVPTGTPNPENLASQNASLIALCKSRRFDDAKTLAQASVSGSWAYVVATPAQERSNFGIWWVAKILRSADGMAASHDYLVANGNLSRAGDTSLEIGLLDRAIAEYGQAATADPANAKAYEASILSARARSGTNVNSSVMAAINSWGGMIPLESAQRLYVAWNPVGVSSADNIAFYNLLLSAVEINKKNAAFVGKIIDQKAKLAQ